MTESPKPRTNGLMILLAAGVFAVIALLELREKEYASGASLGALAVLFAVLGLDDLLWRGGRPVVASGALVVAGVVALVASIMMLA